MSLDLNTANPIVILILTFVAILIVILSRKTEKRFFSIIGMFTMVIFLIYHSIVLNNLERDSELIIQTYHCMVVDLAIFLIFFFSFLWVDNIISKKRKLESYEDSLGWFWEKLF